MSYGLKYTLTFRDAANIPSAQNALYKMNIYCKGYGGSSSSVYAGNSPMSLSYKKQDLINPMMGSELTIALQSTSNEEFIEFSTADPLKYYVDVLRSLDNGSSYQTIWSGVNTTDCYTEPWRNTPYEISLKFNCGIGELQWHRYENPSSLITGMEQLIAIISNCLSFLPYQKNVREIINIREDTMSDTKGLLEQLYLLDLGFTEIADDGVLHGIESNRLLNKILTSLNCRIYQANNMWYVERIFERTNNTMTYYDYTPTGAIQNPPYTYSHIGTGSFNSAISINNASQPKLINEGELAMTQKKPSLAYEFNTLTIGNVELITNPYFEDTPTAKNNLGQPVNWDLGTHLTGNPSYAPMNIEKVNPFTDDKKREWGMSFGSVAVPDFNAHLVGLNKPLNQLFTPANMPDSWAAHSVRRSGDTYSNSSVYIDPTNGSLAVDLEYYFDFRFTPHAARTITQLISQGGDVNNLLFGPTACNIIIPIRFKIVDPNGSVFCVSGNINNGGFLAGQWINNDLNVAQIALLSFVGLNNCFPDPEYFGQNAPISAYQMAQLWKQAQTNSTHFDLRFNYKLTFNAPFNPSIMTYGDGIYDFDCKIFPPVLFDGLGKPGTYFRNLNSTYAVLWDFAANVIDFQYKDSFIGASSFTNFYQAADINNRWNEQKVSVVFGDSITPGYPGSYRISNAQPTRTWHLKGNSKHYTFDTGHSNADPGSGKLRFDTATISSIAHIYIDNTDADSISESSWIGTIVSGKTLVVSDTTSGRQVTFTTGTPVSHSGYYDIPVTYVSDYGSPATFLAGETIQIAYQAGQILADILFQNYEALIASYRRALTGKIINNGGIGFWQNITDTYDGVTYAQTGSQFDLKKALLTINMEEVSVGLVLGTKGFSAQGSMNQPPSGNQSNGNGGLNQVAQYIPLSNAKSPLGKQVIVNNKSNLIYPLG